MREANERITRRRQDLWWIVALLAVLIGGARLTWTTVERADRHLRRSIEQQAEAAAAAIGLKQVGRLAESPAGGHLLPEHLRLKQQLDDLRHADARVRRIVLLGRRPDGGIYRLADSEPTGSPAAATSGRPLGTVSSELLAAFNRSTLTTEGPSGEGRPAKVVAWAPLVDPRDGKPDAVLGLECDVTAWKRDLFRRAVLPPVLFTLAVAGVLILGWRLLAAAPPATSPAGGRRIRPLHALTAACGLALTATAVWTLDMIEHQQRSRTFSQLADGKTDAVLEALRDLRDEQLESLGSFYEASEYVDAGEFADFTRHLLANRAIQAWEWVAAVPATQKALFEQEARAEGLHGYTVWQHDQRGRWTPAAGRGMHFPVLRAAPAAGNEPALGFDLGSEPIRRAAIAEAVRTGLPAATMPVELVQDESGGRSMLFMRPVFRGDGSGQLQGLALAVARLDALLPPTNEACATLLELALLGPQGKVTRLVGTGDPAAPSADGFGTMRPFFGFGKVFAVQTRPSPAFARLYPRRARLLAGLTGLLLTAMAVAVAEAIRRRQRELEGLVAERTTQLQESLQEHRLLHDDAVSAVAEQEIVRDGSGRPVDCIFLKVNPAFEKQMGVTREDVIGRRASEVLPDLVAPDLLAGYGEVLRTGGPASFEHHAERLARYCLVNVHRLDDGRFTSVFNDITPIKQAQDALHRRHVDLASSYGSIRDLTEAVADILWAYRIDADGRPLEVWISGQADRLLGRPAGTIGDSFEEYFAHVHPEDRGRVVARFEKALQEPGTEDRIEYRLVREDGGHLWVESRGTIKPLPDGSVKAYGRTADITERKQAELELARSRERFALAVQGSNDGIWDWDLRTDSLFLSLKWKQQIGYGDDELPNVFASFQDHLHPDDRPDVMARVDAYLQGRSPQYQCEFRLRHRDGSYRWILARGEAIRDESGIPVRMAGSHTDITERKQAEQQLHEYAARLRGITDAARDAIIMMDDRGRISFWNPAAETILGYSGAEAIGQDLHRLLAPERFHPAQRTAFARFQKTGCGEAIGRTVELAARRKDGREVTIALSLSAFALDDRWQSVGILRDITQQKIAEDKLRENEERMRSLLNSMQDLVFVLDENLVFRSCHQPAADKLYLPLDRFIGRRFDEIGLPAESSRTIRQALDHTLETGRAARAEYFLDMPEGRAWFDLCATPYRDKDEHITGLTCVVRDISDLKRAEADLQETNRQLETATMEAREMALQAEMASIAKSEFLANMSHEIRTPLNGVVGMTGLLLDTDLDADQRRYAETVQASSETLLGLINDILDFSKVEAGKLELEDIGFDLERLVEDAAACLAVKAHEKGLELVCDLPPEMPTRLVGDPGRLRQILTNLTGNAVKFTETGEIVIKVRVQDESPSDIRLRCSVIDTGIGIAADKHDALFQQFTQVDASATRRHGGTGLGLAIARQLVELMGGAIGVASDEGRGSEFWFEITLAKQDDRGGSGREHRQPTADLADRRVLLVDGNASAREALHGWLTSLGLRVATAAGVEDARTALGQALDGGDPFSLALLDKAMSDTDGLRLARTLRADERLRDLPLVFLTAVNDRGEVAALEALGDVACLTKPARRRLLREELGRVLARRSRRPSQARASSHRIGSDDLQDRFAGRPARILLAEDNRTNQQVALGILGKFGLAADVVDDGAKAIAALADEAYDLVLMDIQMPVMDGIRATRRIRSPRSNVRNRRVPIVAMTAHAMAGDREQCLHAGMDDYLTKPVSPHALAEILDRWLPMAAEADGIDDAGGRPDPSVPAPADDDQPIWNRPEMLERLLGDEALGDQIVGAFLADLPDRLAALADHLQAADAAGVVLQAHTIKGAAANVGAQRLHRAIARIEEAAQAGDLAAVRASLPELDDLFGQLREAMESFQGQP